MIRFLLNGTVPISRALWRHFYTSSDPWIPDYAANYLTNERYLKTVLVHNWSYHARVMVKQFHDHTGRISLEVLRIFADFHVHKNQCLIPGWTRSFADNVRYLTLVTKGNSCIRIWNEIGKSALRIRFIDAVSFSCSSTVVFFALKYCGERIVIMAINGSPWCQGTCS